MERVNRFVLRLITLVIVIAPGQPLAAATIRQYSIGNSLTGLVLLDHYQAMAATRGNTVTWGLHLKPGGSLDYILQNPDTPDTFTQPPYGNWINALNNYSWDVVTLEPFARPLDGPTGDRANVLNFLTYINSRNPNALVYLYQTWPVFDDNNTLNYHDWWLQHYSGGDDSTVRTRDFFNQLMTQVRADSPLRKRVQMLPVGDVLFELNERMHAGLIPGYTDISQFYGDGIHLNLLGSYTAAVTWYSTIFHDDPHGLPTTGYGTIDPTLAYQIQDAAWKITRNPRLDEISPVQRIGLKGVPEPGAVGFIVAFAGSIGLRRRRFRSTSNLT
jgi:hypothetical protein